jgi:5-methylcytosine-specific restriction enzyme A
VVPIYEISLIQSTITNTDTRPQGGFSRLRTMRRDSRSEEAQAWRQLYRTTAWRKGRVIFLRQHPLCERCEAQGRVTAATVVNHRTPHKGDLVLFHSVQNWEACCKPCHDRDVRFEEERGYSKEIGLDGWPVSPNHPANKSGR